MSTDTIDRPPAGAGTAPRRLSTAAASLATGSPVGVALAALTAAVDAVFAIDPLGCTDVELLAILDAVETLNRRAPAARDGVVAEIDTRGLAQRARHRHTASYLAERYRLSAGEGHGWVKAAVRFTAPRSISTGEPLPAAFPVLGKARRAGRVSDAQARVITEFLQRLPATVDPDRRARAEAVMVGRAATSDPAALTRLGQRLLDHLDPDGDYRDPAEVARRRGLSFGRARDGLTPLSGALDPWTAEALRAVLEPLAKPGRLRDCADTPHLATPAGVADSAAGPDAGSGGGAAEPDAAAKAGWDARTTPQRLHDALREAMELLLGATGRRPQTPANSDPTDSDPADSDPANSDPANSDTDADLDSDKATDTGMASGSEERSGPPAAASRFHRPGWPGIGALPRQGGLPATLLLRSTLSQLEARTGLVSTAHGGLIPMREVLRHATKLKIIDVITDDDGNPLFLGRTRRLASTAQRYALAVRDRGCVIPGCTVPPDRCEAHHLTDYALGGSTDINKLALLCPYDHDHIAGWILRLFKGRIWATPPPHLGADPTPRTNDYFHDPPLTDDD